jgi:hypothetical protein
MLYALLVYARWISLCFSLWFGLGLNACKTKSLTFNIADPEPLHVATRSELVWEDHIKYLGSWVQSSERHQYPRNPCTEGSI